MNVDKGYTQFVINKIKTEIQKAVINQEQMTDMALASLLTGGHVLLEGVPGLAKTLWVRALSFAMDADFNRVQFTSDLMPSDIIGTKIFNQQRNEFELKKGPLFTTLFLADEINRTPPKTQSALLEVMEERTITIDGEDHRMNDNFMVVATQNPLEYEGTYPLPEALTDRFLMKLVVDYPGLAAEKQILSMYDGGFDSKSLSQSNIQKVCAPDEISACRFEIGRVHVDDGILNYILNIIEMTRRINVIANGASPRGSISLLTASKSLAAMRGRDFVIPDDVYELAVPVLRHRIILKPEAEIDGMKTDKVIENILSQIKAPR